LKELPFTVTGTLSLRDLSGHDWILRYLDWDEAVPAEPQVILTIEGNRVTGSSGCNHYFADVTAGAPGQIFHRSFAARFSWESLRAVADDPRPPSLPGSTSEKPQRVAHLDSPSDLGSQILDETGGWCCVGGCLSDRGS